MRYLRINEALSSVDLCYWLAGKKGSQSRAISNVRLSLGWPAYRALLNRPNHYILRGNLSLTKEEVVSGFSVYANQSGDSLLPPDSTLKYSLVQAPTKEPTKDYAKRKDSGEILMNNYSVGEIKVERRAGYSFTGGLVGGNVSYGYYTYSSPGGYPGGEIPPCALPNYGANEGETFRYASVYIVFDIVNVPNATYDLSPLPMFLEDTFSIDTELVTSVVADCNDGTYDLLTEMVEFPETLGFVVDSTKRALLLTENCELESRAMKKSMMLEKFLKWNANHWLKLRYALLPIFYSIVDVSKVLKDMGREYAEYRRQKVLNSSVPIDPMSGALTFSVENDCVHRCMVKSRYTPDSLISDFRRMININLLNSAWELTTSSFVFDWGVNVGEFLNAVSGSDGSTDSKCCYSVRDCRTVTISYSGDTSRPVTTVVFNTYKRQVINPVDHIGLTTRFDMNWKRYTDAFALSLNPILKRIRSLR